MEDFESEDSLVSDILSLEAESIHSEETCASLINGFQHCKLAEKNNLSSNNNSNNNIPNNPQVNVPNTDHSNKTLFQENSKIQSCQESSSNNQQNCTKKTREIGINTEKSFNFKVRNRKRPYFNYTKYSNKYHHFRQKYQIYNWVSKKQHEKWNHDNYNRYYKVHKRWQYREPQWQEEQRMARGFYFFYQLMKCFNDRF